MKYSTKMFKPEQLGIVKLDKVKCGKLNCHCIDEKPHSAYYHYFYEKRADGTKLKKKYLPKHEAKKMQQIIRYRRNQMLFDIFVPLITGELFLFTEEKCPDKISEYHKRLHIILKRAGVNSFSRKKIQQRMKQMPQAYDNKLLATLS